MSRKTMAATQVLSESDKFFIETKHKEGLSSEKITEAVGKNAGLVKDHIATLKPVRVKSQYEVARGKQTSDSGKTKVAVATSATSSASDEHKKITKGNAFKIKYGASIAKAKEDD